MQLQPLHLQNDTVLYQQVANSLQSLIEAGTLQPGDRIPSVRKLRTQLSVSTSTVLEAYRLLEDRGLIEPKPRSGYFVKSSQLHQGQEPTASFPPNQACSIDLSLAMRINSAMNQPQMIQLGGATPSPDLLPLASLNRILGQTIRQQPQLTHSYGSVLGCLQLRHEIGRRLIEAGCAVSPEQIVITNGTTEAVYLCLQAATKAGDVVAVQSPTYYGFLEALASLHLQVLELPTHPQEGICLTALEAALQTNQVAACLFVSNFSNPLGSCPSELHKQQLVNLITRYQIPLIEDDIYGDLYFSGSRPKAFKAYDQVGWVLYCASFSKTLSPGLRIGWTIPSRYHQAVEHLKLGTNYATSVAPQLAIAQFLSHGGYDRHLRRLRSAYCTQVSQMQHAIYQFFPPETKVTRPNGGHVLWIELPPTFDTLKLYSLAYQQGISIAPGVMFSTTNHYHHCLRLNCGFPWSSTLEQAVKTLGNLINSL